MITAGQRIGPYEIVAPLGKGGMGEVWRARDTRLGREVALKFLPGDFADDPERHARFEREAKLLASLNHPHIAVLYGLEHLDGQHALAMELVEGEGLDERIERGPISVEDAVPIALQIAEALEAAHEKGIVHRDLKPANVRLRADGAVKVLDFGLAKTWEEPAAGSDLAFSPTITGHHTRAGMIMGTAAYMSPEQAKGFAVDKRADIWAFGVVLYEMLTGAVLFVGDGASDTLAAVLRADIGLDRLPAGSSPEIRRLLRRCLERNPRNRLHDIADARLVLDDVVAGRADGGTVASPSGAAARAATAKRGWLAVPGALAGGVALAAGAFLVGRGASRGPAVHAAPAAVRFQQITDTPGVESQPSLSPDGKDVVFARVVDGRSEIMIQRVGARVSTSLTSDSGVDNGQPAFSPSGDRIAFRSERDGGGVFVMDSSGESVRRLSDFGFYPTWSPDGREVAVAVGDFTYPTDRGGAIRGLWAIDVATGAKREISRMGDVMQPRWSPHGRRIAFWGLRQNGGQRDLFTVAADGSEADGVGREVTNDAALDWSPEWSPDGRYLYFASNRGGTMNLWRVAIDEASGKVLGAPEPVTAPTLWAGGLSFSRDGRRLAYGSLDWRTTLYRAELDAASGRLAGPPRPLLQGTQPIRDHQLSPDGQWLVFMRMTAGEDLFVARVDGSQSRRLTDDVFRDRGPSWSPDGQRIAFYSDRSGGYQIWLIRPDGSGLSQATNVAGGSPNFPVWSPNGQRLAFSLIPGGGQLLDLSHGALPAAPVALPRVGEDQEFWPTSWSPDGRRLAGIVVRGSGAIEQVAIHDLAAKSYQLLKFSDSRQWRFPVWLSDSRRLVVRDGRGIWLLDPGKGEPRRLVTVGGYATGVSVGVSRDDRWLTWSETGTEGDIWVAELR